MSLSMHLLLGISLMIVFHCVDEVQSYDGADAEKLIIRFAEFVAILQENINCSRAAQLLLGNYRKLKFKDVPTLQDFERVTGNLLQTTAASITQTHSKMVETAIQDLCTTINDSLGDGLRYANLPLRNELEKIFVKAHDTHRMNYKTIRDEEINKFNATVCPL